jgi:SAM-dependent methyltransferase
MTDKPEHPGLHDSYEKGIRLDGMVERAKLEWHYLTQSEWTFEDVGAHWDETEEYDDVNAETYSYFQRFVDGLKYSTLPDKTKVLDICCRTGNGTAYFAEHGKISYSICADVSERFLSLADEFLNAGGVPHETLYFDRLPLPLADNSVEGILCFETLEHVPDAEAFLMEMGRVIETGGEMILTTPNFLWEPVHSLAAILDLHHSEGPHRFLHYRPLVELVNAAGFDITVDRGTILVPDGPDWLIQLGRRVESLWPAFAHQFALRRILICHRR